jgi:hypothetical protein
LTDLTLAHATAAKQEKPFDQPNGAFPNCYSKSQDVKTMELKQEITKG